ncbi:HAD hydrolase-like protein [Alpinimonas psychrophila]|uniref:Phosphoglycolate phosphatase n=1 Tax=Alpinimonas psychrophila TaxID=748908 RepID=A0A7W3JUI7_9MICO|nr:HAD hydrolase-like protein [Alpinimonas psychrophila]MBA8829400.1 phosphoglycolate phosphatase [Alpinimonas psychrophila]
MTTTLTRNWTSVLFDLDGTILDSAPGIVQSLVDTFAYLGLPVPPHDELMHYVGPPLLDSFRNRAGLSEEAAQNALRVYRQDFRKDGAFDSAVFPGIVGLLESLAEADVPMAIVTSKPEAQASRILDHFDLRHFFTVVAGATEDETRATKTAIVGHALAELAALGHDTSLTVMVGDRIYDVEGAAAFDVPSIIVEWGYGSPAEAKGAMATVYSTDRLRGLLLGG